MRIKLLHTVEHPVVFPIGQTGVTPVEGSAGAIAQHVNEEFGQVREIWKMLEGSVVDMADAPARALLGLGYAQQV